MQFLPSNHANIRVLNRELIHLKEFASKFPCLNNQDIFDFVVLF